MPAQGRKQTFRLAMTSAGRKAIALRMVSVSEPRSLYHFVDTTADERKCWIEDLLLHHRVYFRQRDQLNDPSELRPQFIVMGKDEQLRDYIRKIRQADPRRLSPARRLLEEKRLLHRIRSSPQMPEEQLHDLLGQIGVFCLSDSYEHLLMWAHYANGHRGMAIEFDSNEGLFSVAQRVTYSDDPPVIDRLKDDWTLMLEKSMLWKSKQWSYEQEWRVIARFRDAVRQELFIDTHRVPPGVLPFLRAQNGPGLYDIPASAVRRVLLGVRMSAEDETWVRSVVLRRAGSVQVVRTALHHGSVRLPA
jgi:DUF2971 family protein